MATTAKRIAEARRALGLSQQELAQRTGLAQTTVSKWENGGSVPSVPNIERLAEALDVSPAWLACKTNRVSPGEHQWYLGALTAPTSEEGLPRLDQATLNAVVVAARSVIEGQEGAGAPRCARELERAVEAAGPADRATVPTELLLRAASLLRTLSADNS